jgi:hypothetical protein
MVNIGNAITHTRLIPVFFVLRVESEIDEGKWG